MSISPSHRSEIRKLVGRLASADGDDARAAAARLLVIGPPALSAVGAVATAGGGPEVLRALRLLPHLDRARAIEPLEAALRDGAPEARRLAAELLVLYPTPRTVRLLEAEARECGGETARAILVTLHVLARGGVDGASGAFSGLVTQASGGLTPEDLLARAGALEGRLEVWAQDPLAPAADRHEAGDPTGETGRRAELREYLALEPDSDREVVKRRSLAASLGVDRLAALLASEHDVGRLSLLCLLAAELRHARMIVPLRRVVALAHEKLAARAPDRPAWVALSARSHAALAVHKSRLAAVELVELLRQLGPDELRIEHLHAVELIGSKSEIVPLVPLCSLPGWLGDAAFRVVAEIVAREGMSPRSALLRGLPAARRKELVAARASGKRAAVRARSR